MNAQRPRRKNRIWLVPIIFVAMATAALFMFRSKSEVILSVSSLVPGVPLATPIEITIVYAPEEALYLDGAIDEFNQRSARGLNPLTGDPLEDGSNLIHVTGRAASSGSVHQGIINAVIAPNHNNVERPTIFSPSVSHWLALVNYQTGQAIFDLNDSPPTALTPVVIAIWESRLEAIRAKVGQEAIGWEELLQVLNAPNGWGDYGISGRQEILYGHTDPAISSTALSTLMAEFYASARYTSEQDEFRALTRDIIKDDEVQQGVRDIEAMIKHYSARTTEFKEYIARGPDYVDFVALEENDLIYINQGKTEYKPAEKLVALYPKEGTFWHEHPFAIPNTDWVSDEQRAAAKLFTDFVRSPPIQERVMAAGFRPVNPEVVIGAPFTAEFGVDITQPSSILPLPDPATIAEIQLNWQYVKKQADIMLVVDVSGSMEGEKLRQAKTAVLRLLEKMPSANRVGLITFGNEVNEQLPLTVYEEASSQLDQQIRSLMSGGQTSLYDAIIMAKAQMAAAGDDRIRAIVLLSDGQDTISTAKLPDLLAQISEQNDGVLIFPVAYGADADTQVLNLLARESATKLIPGNPENIEQLFELMSSYF